jgi:hypothetical protein
VCNRNLSSSLKGKAPIECVLRKDAEEIVSERDGVTGGLSKLGKEKLRNFTLYQILIRISDGRGRDRWITQNELNIRNAHKILVVKSIGKRQLEISSHRWGCSI